MQVETSELQKLFEVMEERNLSITNVITLIQGKSESVQAKTMEKEFNLSVDYSRTVQEMINAGNYDWTNSDITAKHFPLPKEHNGKKVPVSSKLFHFNRAISSEDATSEMDKAGYRPATLAELLALGEAHPELQKEFPIVALGSVWRDADGNRFVPSLNVSGYKRGLDLDWFGYGWRVGCRFLAVRK
jgi:hypothetical protein